MKYLKSFKLLINESNSSGNKYVTDQMTRHRIKTSILMDVLSEITDETHSDFKLEQDEYIDGPICYTGDFEPHISMKYLDTIKRALAYYYDETGEEVIAKVDSIRINEIRWVSFIRNESGIELSFFQNKDFGDSIFLSRKGRLTL